MRIVLRSESSDNDVTVREVACRGFLINAPLDASMVKAFTGECCRRDSFAYILPTPSFSS